MARDAEKFGRTSVSENEHPDYGMLKLEADMRENKDIINWIASNKQSMVNYLEINNNSKGASHCMRYLFKTWSNKEDFVTPTEFYKSVTRAGFQTSSKPNLALSTRPSQQAIDIGYLGFSNVLHSFFEGRNDEFANQFKGYIINDMFKVNGLPSSIQFEFLGAIFDFGITNGRTNDVVFRNNGGKTLLDNGLNTNESIDRISDADKIVFPEILRFRFKTKTGKENLLSIFDKALGNKSITIGDNGRVSLNISRNSLNTDEQKAFFDLIEEAINNPKETVINVYESDLGIVAGDFGKQAIDIDDILKFEDGELGANQTSILGHEIKEQFEKQANNIKTKTPAHAAGEAIESKLNGGFERIKDDPFNKTRTEDKISIREIGRTGVRTITPRTGEGGFNYTDGKTKINVRYIVEKGNIIQIIRTVK